MPTYSYRCITCPLTMPDVYRRVEERDLVMLCPDCCVPMERYWPSGTGNGVIDDSIPGGLVLENYGPQEIKVYSHTERRRLLKVDEHGRRRRDKTTGQEYELAEMVRHIDGSPHTSNWASAMDAQTLENARVLVSRAGAKGSDSNSEDVPNEPDCAPPEGVHLFNRTSDDAEVLDIIRKVQS